MHDPNVQPQNKFENLDQSDHQSVEMEGGFETKDERGTMMPLNDEETLKIEAEYSVDPEEKA